jgi:hypothetical protein
VGVNGSGPLTGVGGPFVSPPTLVGVVVVVVVGGAAGRGAGARSFGTSSAGKPGSLLRWATLSTVPDADR